MSSHPFFFSPIQPSFFLTPRIASVFPSTLRQPLILVAIYRFFFRRRFASGFLVSCKQIKPLFSEPLDFLPLVMVILGAAQVVRNWAPVEPFPFRTLPLTLALFSLSGRMDALVLARGRSFFPPFNGVTEFSFPYLCG